MNRLYRILPSLASVIVGAASFALSYVALRDVSAQIGAVPDHLAFLVPIVIDGGIICGSAVIWAQSRAGTKRQLFPFLFVASMVIMSVVVNTAHAGDNTLAQTIAALPPLVLLGSLELVAMEHRRRHASEAETEEEAADTPKEVSSSAVTQQTQAAASRPKQQPRRDAVTSSSSAQQTSGRQVTDLPEYQPDRELVGVGATNGNGSGNGSGGTSNGNGSNGRRKNAAAQSRPKAASNGSGTRSAAASAARQSESEADSRRRPRVKAEPPADVTTAVDAEQIRALLPNLEDTSSKKDASRELFNVFVEAGGDPEHPQLTNAIAAKLDTSRGYVAKAIRPLRA